MRWALKPTTSAGKARLEKNAFYGESENDRFSLFYGVFMALKAIYALCYNQYENIWRFESMRRRATNKWSRKSRFYKRRRSSSISTSNLGPILALLGTVLGIVGVICLIVFVALPRLLPLIGIDYHGPGTPTPSPQAIARPTPTPHPMDGFDAVSAANEVVFDGYMDYSWFSDPYFYNDVMLLSGGKLVDGQAVMNTLLRYYPETRTAEVLPIRPNNTHIMFAKCNDDHLVYLDAKENGGGTIMAVDLKSGSYVPKKVKDIYTGLPEIMLGGNYLAWIDRTGTRMDKLFVCDLTSMESTTLAMFSSSPYGESLPCLQNGMLFWADADSGSGENSMIHSIALTASTSHSYAPGTYAHDPQGNGRYLVWLDAHHSEEANLYYSENEGAAQLVASGVVQCGLSKHFVAYSKDEAIYAFVFDNKKTYRISSDRENAMFLGVSEDKVAWMDVTSRERDIVKFARIPA